MSWRDAPIVETTPTTAGTQPAVSRWQSAPVVGGEQTPAPLGPPRTGRQFATPTPAPTPAPRPPSVRERLEESEWQGDLARGQAGISRERRDAQAIEYGTEENGGKYTLLPIEQVPGAATVMQKRREWYANPANRGKTPPVDLFHVLPVESGDGKFVSVSPRMGNMLLTNLQAMVGTPNVEAPGLLEGLITGNDVEVAEDLARRSARLNELGGFPLGLTAGPETDVLMQQQLLAPGGRELGVPEGVLNAFVRGSNQLGASVAGGGAEILGEVAGSEGLQQWGTEARRNLEGVADAFPGSESAQGFNPSSYRWWIEGTAQQLPNFAAMAAPGLAAGRVLTAMGATERAVRITQGVTSFSSAAGFEASAAYGQIYDRLIQSGATEEDARALALTESATIGVINGALERVAFGELFMRDTGAMTALQRAVRGYLAEGTTEGIQEWVPMAVGSLVERGELDAPTAKQWEEMLSSALLGGLMGAGTGALMEGGGEQQQQEPGAAYGPDQTDALIQRLGQQLGSTPAAPGAAGGPGTAAPPTGSPSAPVAAGEPDWSRATFEDAPPVDPASVDELIARVGAQVATATAPETAQPPQSPAVEEPDWQSATFEDAPPVPQDAGAAPETAPGASATPPTTQTPSAAGEGPLIAPGEAWGTVHATAQARVVAQRLAKQTGKPVYLVNTPEGVRLDRRRPDHEAIVIQPDGSGSVSGFVTQESGSVVEQRPKRRASDAPTPQQGNKYAQSDPAYQGQKEKLRAATFAPGQLVHGTTAQDIAAIAAGGIAPSGLSDRVDVERIGDSGRMVGTALSYAGKGGKGDPAVIVLKPGVKSFDTDGGANAQGTDAIRPSDIAGVIFGDGTRVRWSEAVKYAADKYGGPADRRQAAGPAPDGGRRSTAGPEGYGAIPGLEDVAARENAREATVRRIRAEIPDVTDERATGIDASLRSAAATAVSRWDFANYPDGPENSDMLEHSDLTEEESDQLDQATLSRYLVDAMAAAGRADKIAGDEQKAQPTTGSGVTTSGGGPAVNPDDAVEWTTARIEPTRAGVRAIPTGRDDAAGAAGEAGRPAGRPSDAGAGGPAAGTAQVRKPGARRQVPGVGDAVAPAARPGAAVGAAGARQAPGAARDAAGGVPAGAGADLAGAGAREDGRAVAGAGGDADGGRRNVSEGGGERRDRADAPEAAGGAAEGAGRLEGRAAEQLTLARQIAALAKDKTKKLTAIELFKMADAAFGGTMGQGKYDAAEAYEAVELAINLLVADPQNLAGGQAIGLLSPELAKRTAAGIRAVIDRMMPTQTRRSAEKQAMQQFSTPADYAYVAQWIASPRFSDVLLEPSAGTGSLVNQAGASTRRVELNELDKNRLGLAATVAERGGRATVGTYAENAEQIANILPKRPGFEAPSLVVMNPPFSQTAGRLKNKKVLTVAGDHIEQALRLLRPGGRLVAIVGEGMSLDAVTYAPFWTRVAQQYDVRANVAVTGDIYTKYGTSFGTRLLVIDVPAGGPRPAPIIVQSIRSPGLRVAEIGTAAGLEWRKNVVGGSVDSLDALIDTLDAVRRDRPAMETPGLGGPQRPAEAGRVGTGRDGGLPAGPGADGAGNGPASSAQPGGDRAAGGRAGVTDAAQPATGDLQRPGGSAGTGGSAARPGAGDGGGRDSGRPGTDPATTGLTNVPPTTTPATAGVSGVELEAANTTPKKAAKLTAANFTPYEPSKVKVKGATPPTADLVESAAMGSVAPPDPKYVPTLTPEQTAALSTAQAEAVVYAGQAFQRKLADGRQMGFFIGDGTGVGKGRTIAAIMADSFNRGAKKAVWVSDNRRLFQDAMRDLEALGIGKFDAKGRRLLDADGKVIAHDQGDVPSKEAIGSAREGVLFTGYGTLKSGRDEGKKKGQSRVKQIVDWLGADFDGVIAFDEAHKMKNAVAVKGKGAFGDSMVSETALAAADLQAALPKAKVLYLSATGATEVENLAYLDRLPLWGEGTPFPDKMRFINEIKAGGLSAMELVARDMKQMGVYLARRLALSGKSGTVKYSRLTHALTEDQRAVYDKLAESWGLVLRNINAALQMTAAKENGKVDGRARAAAMSAFWSGHQRFFNVTLTALKVPSLIESIEKDIAAGHQIVVQLTSTNQAAQERAIGRQTEEGDGELNLEELDTSPKDQVIELVRQCFPTAKYESYTDENGNERLRPVKTADGDPVEDQRAVAMREQLIADLASIRAPDSPLDQILNHFGPELVGENTGRTRRLVPGKDDKGNPKRVLENRSSAKALADVKAFQAGQKRILIFSQAGGTGASYHADLKAGNQALRRHYVLQPGWSADQAVQGLGRTHRSNQKQPPELVLVSTDLKGETRFTSTIARRLDQLGALVSGQRQAGSSGLFSAADNLESSEARDALNGFFNALLAQRVPGVDEKAFAEATGLRLRDEDGRPLTDGFPPVTQFLNRLLSLPVDMQNTVFDAFASRLEAIVTNRRLAGTLDEGLKTVQADGVRKVADKVARTGSEGETTRYVHLELKHKTRPVTFESLMKGKHGMGRAPDRFVKQARSGKVYALFNVGQETDARSGVIRDMLMQMGPARTTRAVAEDFADTEKWSTPTDEEAKAAWAAQVAAVPEFETEPMHLIVGTLLPVWDRVRGQPRLFRVQTDAGETLLGRRVDDEALEATLEALGVQGDPSQRLTPAQGFRAVLDEGKTLVLSDKWQIVPARVAGEVRIEVKEPAGVMLSRYASQFANQGLISETHNYRTRWFIPSGDNGPAVMERYMAGKDIVKVIGGGGSRGLASSHDTERGLIEGDDQAIPHDMPLQTFGPGQQLPAHVAEFWSDGVQPTPAAWDNDDPALGELGAKIATAGAGRIRPKGLPGGQPKTLKTIISDFATALGTRVRNPARQRRRVAGSFTPASGRVGIRFAGDLDTAAHELAHWLDDNLSIMEPWYTRRARSPYDAELIPHFSGHGSVTRSGPHSTLKYARAEGAAEWLRAYIVNPDAAKAAAPAFAKFMEGAVPADVWAKIDAFSADVRRLYGASGVQQTLANVDTQIGAKPPTTLAKLRGLLSADVLRTELTDDRWPLIKATREALLLRQGMGLKPLQVRNNPEVLARLFSGEDAKVQDAVENGVPRAFSLDERADDVEGGIDWIMAPLAEGLGGANRLQQLQERAGEGIAYLVNRRFVYKAQQWRQDALDKIAALDPLDPTYAKRVRRIQEATELRVQRMLGTGAGLKSDEAVAMKALAELTADPDKLARLDEFARRYEAHARGLLQYMVDMGRMSRESFNDIIARNDVYADLHRVVEDVNGKAKTAAGLGKKLGTAKTLIHQFQGSTLEIANPIVNLMEQTAAIIHDTDRNYVVQQFTELLVNMKQDSQGNWRPREMHQGDLIDFDAIGSMGRAGDKHAIKVWVNGRPQHWQFRPDVYEALKGVGTAPELGPVLRAVSLAVKGIPQTFITQSPAFVARQLIRDVAQRSIVSRVGSGLKEAVVPFSAAERSQLAKLGGTQAGLYMYDEGWTERMNRSIKALAGEPRTAALDPRRFWHWWTDRTADLGDTRPRLAEYQKAFAKFKADGLDDFDAGLAAAKEARDLIDYAVAGAAVRRVMPFVMFLNPAIQGPIRTLKAFREAPGRTAAKVGLYVLIPRLVAALLRGLMGDEEEYQQLPAWRKDFFINVKLGPWWLTLPQPYELGVLGSLVERTIAQARGYGNSYDGVGGSLATAALPLNFDMPLGGIAKAAIENSANYSFFFQRPIVPKDEEGRDPSIRSSDKASRLGRAGQWLLSPFADLDARKVDNVLYNMFGGVGGLAMNVSDIGREDRSIARALDSTLGLTRQTPLWEAEDVKAVMDTAERLGMLQSKPIRELKAALIDADQAPTLIEKNRRAARVRQLAKEMRAAWQRDYPAMLREAQDRYEARTGGRR